MRTALILAAAAAGGALWTLSGQALRPSSRPLEDPDAYAVIASLLPSEWSVRDAHAKRLVFQQETETYRQCMPSGPPLETDWKLVVESFWSENATTRLLRGDADLGIPYVVVPREEVRATLLEVPRVPNDPASGWTGFYRHYPDSGGFMIASAVGFDAAKKRAMVYLSHTCGGLCGGGQHHLLEKVDGRWREARVEGLNNCIWAS
ncbi:MAG TPA: hypothetical protein VEU08_22750 [Vicinamibacterales bacterium]|nr:hypothetical protein [Vicinamibacterales bacterium]